MVPVSFRGENVVLDPPKGVNPDEVAPLNILLSHLPDGIPVMISCWKLTREELEEINKTGRVWLMIQGTMHPVVKLQGINPFEVNHEKEKEGPKEDTP